jgi:hypothetical protein
VQAAIARLRRKGKPSVPGRVVAELTFGFWTNLLDVRYERRQILWPPLLEAAFPHQLLSVASATDQFPTVYNLGWLYTGNHFPLRRCLIVSDSRSEYMFCVLARKLIRGWYAVLTRSYYTVGRRRVCVGGVQ